VLGLTRVLLSVFCSLCNFVAVYFSFVQFILQLKLCLYATVHFSLDFKKFCQVMLKKPRPTKSLFHTISPIVGSLILGPESRVRVFLVPESDLESGVLNFLTLESKSEETRTPHSW